MSKIILLRSKCLPLAASPMLAVAAGPAWCEEKSFSMVQVGSTGPVSSPEGAIVARFNSHWRLEAPGVWRVVFDNGYDVCNCPKT